MTEVAIMPKVFLGGTVNKSQWRNYVMPKLEIEYFDPVIPEWNEEAYQRELYEREHCDFCVYVLTPKMTGVYAIAEVVDDSNKRPERTLMCILWEDEGETFSSHQKKAMDKVGIMVQRNGAKYFKTLDHMIAFLNSFKNAELPSL